MYDKNIFIAPSKEVVACTKKAKAEGVFDCMNQPTLDLLDSMVYGDVKSIARGFRNGMYEVRYVAQGVQGESLFPEYLFKGIEQAMDDITSALEEMPKLSKQMQDQISMNVQSSFRIAYLLFNATKVSKGDMMKHLADQLDKHSMRSYKILKGMAKRSAYCKRMCQLFATLYAELAEIILANKLNDHTTDWFKAFN